MIIFLYGDDQFRSSQKMQEIKEKFLAASPAGAGLSVFDYENGSLKSRPLDILGMPNLLSPKRLVIIKNLILAGEETERDDILDYLKKNDSLDSDTDIVVVFFENNLPKKTNTLFKFLDKNSKAQNFEKLSGLKLNQWVLKRFKELDPSIGITNSALEKLIAFSGNDTQTLNSEIQKLVNFSGGKLVEETDIEEMVNSNVNISIFSMVDALGNNNKKEVTKLLHEHLRRGEDPFYLFSMFIYQFRNLLKVADAKENQGAPEHEIAKITQLHPFVVKKSLAQIRHFSLARLTSSYRQLAELDTKIKTGKIDIRLALDKFLVEL